MYQFIKPFLDNKISTSEEYGALLTPNHTCLKYFKKSILLPVDVSKTLLDEWQTI